MNDSRYAPLSYARPTGALLAALGLLLLIVAAASAQSTDISFPTPVSTNEISGTIVARDIGDARLTRHFYILAGAPGDISFTVTSNNLNGDVDLFTAGSLRPLGKISMYAGSRATTASKTVFLRQRESLILRIEARSANDNEGTYSISFAGTFEPVMASAATPADESSATPPAVSERRERGVRRVTSSGARIEEPIEESPTRTETTAETTTTPTPAETEAKTGGTVAPVESPVRPQPARTARTTRPRGRRRARVTPQPTPQPQPSEPSTETGTTNSSMAEPALNPRLIIETRDGMRTERFMSTVRSVTVQNGQIVIVSSNGRKVERISLATILKMSIEP
jgi:hypothetical protein